MKVIKIGIMGLMMMLMSNIMAMRVVAATYNGYTYYTEGNSTSMDAAKDHGTALDDVDLLGYSVVETNVKGGTKYKTMKDYLGSSKSYYTIPGLNNTNVLGKNCTTMVPQGICTMDNYVLITAYDSEKKHKSVIYVLDKNNSLKATLVYSNKAHLGGVTYDGTYVWIAEGGGADEGNNFVGAISKSTILSAVKVSTTKSAKSVALKNKVDIIRQQVSGLSSTSYCTYFDNRLWVGTFNKMGTSDIYGYKVNYEYSTSVQNVDPSSVNKPVRPYTYCTPKLNVDRYIQAPKQTQGICFYNVSGTVYLGVSTSYGRKKDSVIRCYKPKDYYDPKNKYNGVMQVLKNDAYRTITMPSMSEQISIRGASMYCIFESAANKYLNNLDDKGHSDRPIGSFCIFSANKIFK